MNKSRQHIYVIIIAILSICAAAWPLLQDGIYYATDGPYHLSRIEGIYLNLIEGVFPAKVHFAAAYTYGYGTGFFYPDFFLYIPAMMMVAGLSLELSWKIFCLLIIIGMYLSMMFAVRILYRGTSPYIGALAATCYIFVPKFAGYLYGSQSVGSATAMMCVPIAIAELLYIQWHAHDRWDLLRFTLATAGIVLSHLTTAIITLVYMCIMCLCCARRNRHDHVLVELIGCMVVGALLTMAFWVPMVEQLVVQTYKFETELIDPISATNETWHSAPSSLGYAILAMLAVVLVVLIWRRYHRQDAGILLAAVIPIVIYLFLAFCPPFWDYFGKWLDWLQFPSRILNPIMATVILTFVGAMIDQPMDGRHHLGIRVILPLTVLILISFYQFSAYIMEFPTPQHLEKGLITEQIAGLGAGEEWLPSDAHRSGLNEPGKAYDPDGNGADGFKHDHGKYYEVYILMDKAYYDVPYLFYKGYEAYLLNDQGEPTEQLTVGKSDRLAYVRVYLPEGREGIGHIMVTYRKTTIQRIAYVGNAISIVAMLGYCVYALLRGRKAVE